MEIIRTQYGRTGNGAQFVVRLVARDQHNDHSVAYDYSLVAVMGNGERRYELGSRKLFALRAFRHAVEAMSR